MKEICLTENAARNHEELFPNHETRLRRTDPEFIELFDNWAFDEVVRQSALDTRTRVLMTSVTDAPASARAVRRFSNAFAACPA